MIDVVVSPVLQSNDPVNDDAANTALPQLFVTATVGAGGIAFGAAMPLPASLIHPFTV